MNTKQWFRSRTLWVNLLALAGLVVQTSTGHVFAPELQAAILTILNVLLRLDTDSAIK